MKDEIRVLLVEDSPDDAIFVTEELEKGGLKIHKRRVDTARDMKDAITKDAWDIILCDYSIPGFGAMPALALLKEQKCDVPVIIISGVIGEDTAVDAMRAGAHDFIVKGKYARLVPAIKREIEDYTEQKAQEAETAKQKHEAEKQRQLAFTMIMQNPQPLLIIDTKFNIKLANESFLTLSGFTEEQLQKMNIREFKVLKKSGHNLKEALETKKGVTGEVTVEFPKGTNHLEQHTIPLLDKEGGIVSIMAVYNDLTDKLAEEAKREELANYITAYLASMADNLTKLSKGNLDFNLEIATASKNTEEAREWFMGINKNLTEVKDALTLLISDAELLSKAAVEGKLDTRADASRHDGDYQKIVKGVNDCLDAVIGPLNVAAEYVDRISKGDIPARISDKYNGDFNEIKNNLNNCIDAVNALVADAGLLSKAAVDGKLDTRADASKHHGDYQKIVKGVNDCLDSVIGPLNVAAEYVDRISKGDIPARISDKYNGDFNEIKNNLNNCIDAVNALVADANMLEKAAVQGKLATRADAGKHMGDYQKIVIGVNNCLDAVIGPLNVAADYVDKISKGAIPAKITDPYNGDFNVIKNNLNNCIDAVNALVADAGLLAKAAVEGKLDTRADASKHQGDYQKIVLGVNDCLDSVIGPLNVAAEYVDRISKGDIPARITDKYNGDFNEIKNNLNNCIDNLNALNADAAMLAKAAIEGNLKTRADASKHQGDFKKIVDGVNSTLDSVIAPVNEALRISIEYAQCNFAARVDEGLQVSGDFQLFKDSLNNIGIEVSKAVVLINQQVSELANAAKAADGGVNDISSGAAQIAKNTGQVNANAEKSNFGVEQVLKAMADLSAAVEEVASSMESVAGLAKNTDTLSADGVKLANKANQSMGRINDSTKIVDNNIIEINNQMKEIGKIVKLIRDIANQTNLLALNAAIEAARAGDAGRGFAVVAAEVKSLAQESRSSAENIAVMIEDLQKRSKKSADAVVQASQQVTQGSRDVEDTLTVFNKIVESVAKISQSSTEVAAATEQQSASVEEITASVHEVSSLIQGTTKEAGDAAAATEEASAALDEIAKVVGKVNTIVTNVSSEMTKFRV